MQKKTFVKIAASLVLGLALCWSANRADAHWVYSAFNTPSTSGTFFFHSPPGLATNVYVGYNSSGTWNNTTNSYAATPNTAYWVASVNRCSSLSRQTSSGAVRVTYQNQRVSAPTCAAYGYGSLVSGQSQISE